MREHMPEEAVAMPDAEAAYLAGLFDGEGSICITRVQPKPPRSWAPAFTLHVTLRMTDRATVELFHRVFGGSFSEVAAKRLRMFCWRSGDWRSVQVLRTLRPFLRIKGRQADLAIQFMETKVRMHANQRVPEIVTQARTEMYEQMGALNHSHWADKRAAKRIAG
jgi:hypothetical protein